MFFFSFFFFNYIYQIIIAAPCWLGQNEKDNHSNNFDEFNIKMLVTMMAIQYPDE